jgi:hypothetical protein
LRTQNGVGRRPRSGASAARKAGVEAAQLLCPKHGPTIHRPDPRGYFRCLAAAGRPSHDGDGR